MPPNGWKWVTLAGICIVGSLVGAYFKVLPSEVPTGILMGVIGLFLRSPMSDGAGKIPGDRGSMPTLPDRKEKADEK
jgi:hypothetical protein